MTGTESRTGLYVYGFLPAAAELPRELTGLGRRAAPVGLIAHNGLALLASDVDTGELAGLTDQDSPDQEALAGWVQEHDRVVRAAFDQAPVLPVRFGTVLTDLTAAVRLLAERHDRSLALLRRVGGRREWGVRLRHAGGAEDTAPAEPDRSSGAAYLAGRQRQLAEAEQRDSTVRQLAAELAEELVTCADEAVDRAGNAEVDLALLVSRAGEDELLDRAAACAARAPQARLDLDLTGPWPPYSFARAWEAGDA